MGVHAVVLVVAGALDVEGQVLRVGDVGGSLVRVVGPAACGGMVKKCFGV